jgi:opacity protein-like surface antigen
MIKTLFKMAFVLIPSSLLAQDNNSILSTYITPYAGITLQGVMNVEQSGTAHKRGSYNAFGTDFDLQVKVKGESESTTGYTYGFTYGSVWNKKGRRLNPGFELDVFRNNASHKSKLSNPNTQEVTNLVGPNVDSVLALIEEEFSPGHHKFSNSMIMDSWNAAVNGTLSYDFSSKFSLNGGIGVGFTAVTLKKAESFQSSPAPVDPGYETTNDNGGGIVNHFNSQPNASNILMFGQLRLSSKIQIVQNVALRIEARSMYMGESTFTFGSTKYTDHAPTDNWNYKIDRNLSYALSLGLCVHLK